MYTEKLLLNVRFVRQQLIDTPINVSILTILLLEIVSYRFVRRLLFSVGYLNTTPSDVKLLLSLVTCLGF